MNIAELKLDLIAKIIPTNDTELLLRINALLIENKNNETQNEVLILNEPATSTYERIRIFSAEEQRKINLAVQQYENGECISDEEAQKEIQEWLED